MHTFYKYTFIIKHFNTRYSFGFVYNFSLTHIFLGTWPIWKKLEYFCSNIIYFKYSNCILVFGILFFASIRTFYTNPFKKYFTQLRKTSYVHLNMWQINDTILIDRRVCSVQAGLGSMWTERTALVVVAVAFAVATNAVDGQQLQLTNGTSVFSANENGTDYEDETSNMTDEEYQDYLVDLYIVPQKSEWVFIALHSIVFVVGLIGNALVCVAVYR